MARPGTFPPGVSGNPKGRPPNNRALTKLIERALSRTTDYKDKRTARKRVMADLLAQAASTGKITFPDGSQLTLKADEWISFVMRLIHHIDGPPKSEIDLDLSGSVGIEGFEEILMRVYGDGEAEADEGD